MTSQPCPFCLIVEDRAPQSRVVYRDEKVVAFFPLSPATTGHTLVVPRRHVSDIGELNRQELHDLAEAVHRVAAALRSGLRPEGLNVIQSNGAAATQTVQHLHIHVVPRWTGDRMVIRWPDSAKHDDTAQDRALKRIRLHLPDHQAEPSPEDRRQHLSFIQAVITRMSQSSATAKTWLLPIVSAAYGYTITKDAPAIALLGALAVVVFGLLDANYLKQERAFRKLYDDVARGRAIPAFALNPALASPEKGTKINYWPDWRDVRSWAILPFYGPLLIAGLAIGVALVVW